MANENMKLPSRNYWEGFVARNEALWDKIRNNAFVNMVAPVKDLSEGNTEAILPWIATRGASLPVRTVVLSLSPSREINALSRAEQIELLGRPVIKEVKPVIKAGSKEFKKVLSRDPQVPVRNNPKGLTYREGADKTGFTIEGDEYTIIPKVRRNLAKQYNLDPYLSQFFDGRPIEASVDGLYGINVGKGVNPDFPSEEQWFFFTEPLLIQLRDKLMSGAIKMKRLGGTIDYFKFFK